jgi:signal transduction histidine kinase
MEFDFKSGKKPPVKSIQAIRIDSVSYQNNVPDVVNYEIVTNNSDIYLDLQAGYSVHPRNIYKYNFQTEKLIQTRRNSIVNKELELLTFNNRDFLLSKKVVVTANTYTQEQAEVFRNSKNADTIKIYSHIKNLIYQYGDFSSYILLFNENLDFAFPPVEFPGWTNYTLSGFIRVDSVPYIISLTNNQLEDKARRKITLCNLQGTVRKQVAPAENYNQLFSSGDEFVLTDGTTLDVYSHDLKLNCSVKGLTFVSGFFDLTSDSDNEFIAFEKNKLVVFSDHFSRKTTFSINQEFSPWPENNHIEIMQKEGKCCFLFNTRMFYYLFSYEKNELALLKYPFYILVFLFWAGLLLLLLRLYTRRLEKDKLHLEQIVSERTRELQLKNRELATQKEEIQSQAEKISQQYERLEKLDQFKESLTHTLVHDLKNPLSQILLQTSNRLVSQSARKMMRLITNMLDVEKYEKTEFRLNKEIHSLRNMLEEVKSGQEPTLHEKNLKVNLHFGDFLLHADKEVMIRVFDNLLSNAIRYSPQNRNIDVLAEQPEGNLLHICIKNLGEPIPEDALPFIFDKYRQFGKSTGNSNRTTGLGLTFCKMAVEAHGGQIMAKNEHDGVVFTITLTGKTDPVQTPVAENETVDFLLTDNQKALLKPFFDRLKNIDVHQISDILQVLDDIPGDSGNIDLLKQRISDAAFAANGEYYGQLIQV